MNLKSIPFTILSLSFSSVLPSGEEQYFPQASQPQLRPPVGRPLINPPAILSSAGSRVAPAVARNPLRRPEPKPAGPAPALSAQEEAAPATPVDQVRPAILQTTPESQVRRAAANSQHATPESQRYGAAGIPQFTPPRWNARVVANWLELPAADHAHDPFAQPAHPLGRVLTEERRSVISDVSSPHHHQRERIRLEDLERPTLDTTGFSAAGGSSLPGIGGSLPPVASHHSDE